MKYLLIAILLGGMVSGCKTSNPSSYTVNSEREPIEAKARYLQQNEGMLALGVHSYLRVVQIELKSGEEIITLSFEGENIFTPLMSGEYSIEKVHLVGYRYFEIDKPEKWTFKINPGEINYVGHLRIMRLPYERSSIDIANRASYMHEFLEREHPEFLSQYKIKYSNFFEDSFFSLVEKGEVVR